METLKLVSEPIGLFAYCWGDGGLGPRKMLVVKRSFQTVHISECLHFKAQEATEIPLIKAKMKIPGVHRSLGSVSEGSISFGPHLSSRPSWSPQGEETTSAPTSEPIPLQE